MFSCVFQLRLIFNPILTDESTRGAKCSSVSRKKKIDYQSNSNKLCYVLTAAVCLIYSDSHLLTCISPKSNITPITVSGLKSLSRPLHSHPCSRSLTCVLVSSLTGSLHACHSRGFLTAQADARHAPVSSPYLLHVDRSINCRDVPPRGLDWRELVQALTHNYRRCDAGYSTYKCRW